MPKKIAKQTLSKTKQYRILNQKRMKEKPSKLV